MTIGPDPMIMTLRMSSRRGIAAPDAWGGGESPAGRRPAGLMREFYSAWRPRARCRRGVVAPCLALRLAGESYAGMPPTRREVLARLAALAVLPQLPDVPSGRDPLDGTIAE